MAFFGMSLHLQHSVKVQCMLCERHASSENPQQELRRYAISRHANSVAKPWSLLPGHLDRHFFAEEYIRVFLGSQGAPANETTLCQPSGKAAWFDRGLTAQRGFI